MRWIWFRVGWLINHKYSMTVKFSKNSAITFQLLSLEFYSYLRKFSCVYVDWLIEFTKYYEFKSLSEKKERKLSELKEKLVQKNKVDQKMTILGCPDPRLFWRWFLTWRNSCMPSIPRVKVIRFLLQLNRKLNFTCSNLTC